ncbi:MAG: hypothetical protein AAGH15_21465 [Myxococcota bacterium]
MGQGAAPRRALLAGLALAVAEAIVVLATGEGTSDATLRYAVAAMPVVMAVVLVVAGAEGLASLAGENVEDARLIRARLWGGIVGGAAAVLVWAAEHQAGESLREASWLEMGAVLAAVLVGLMAARVVRSLDAWRRHGWRVPFALLVLGLVAVVAGSLLPTRFWPAARWTLEFLGTLVVYLAAQRAPLGPPSDGGRRASWAAATIVLGLAVVGFGALLAAPAGIRQAAERAPLTGPLLAATQG